MVWMELDPDGGRKAELASLVKLVKGVSLFSVFVCYRYAGFGSGFSWRVRR